MQATTRKQNHFSVNDCYYLWWKLASL